MPPHYRLACQCFVRNEDILVTFEGDQTLPPQGPHITHAASRYTGGIEIATIEEFLGYAVRVEEDAAVHYDELATEMEACGNQDVAKLFRQLASFSRLHLAEAKSRAGSIDVTKHLPSDYVWPDHATPERISLWAADHSSLLKVDALRAALQGERRGYEFYRTVVAKAKLPETGRCLLFEMDRISEKFLDSLHIQLFVGKLNDKHKRRPVETAARRSSYRCTLDQVF